MHRSVEKGVTLIELMVGLAVLAILLAVAVPSFTSFIDKTRLKKASNAIVDFVNDARGEGVKHGRDLTIAFGGTTTAWCVGANAPDESSISPGDVIPAASACDCTTDGACMVGGVETRLPASSNEGVTLVALPSPASFTFDGRTGVEASLDSHKFTLISPAGDFRLQLEVTPLGQMEVCVPSESRVVSGYKSC